MARARNIKPGFYKNEDLAECSILARLIYPGLWMLADRDGRLEDRPKRIKGELLPYDNADVDKLLDELAHWGLIVRYEVDGRQYIAIPKFLQHQNPHHREAESMIPAPPSLGLDGDSMTIKPEANKESEPVEAQGQPEECRGKPEASLGKAGLNPESPILNPPSSGTPPEASEDLVTPAARITMAMRPFGITANPGSMQVKALAAAGVTADEVTAACEKAKASNPMAPISANYVFGILKRELQEAATTRSHAKPQPERDWQ